MAQADIRVLVPRVRRAVEGFELPQELTDDQMKDVAADACSDVVLYLGSLFGKELLVTHRTDAGAPDEYASSDDLTLPEMSVIAAQAALNHFFFTGRGLKVSETIQDPGSGAQWSYDLSPNLLVAQLKMLKDMRDDALVAIGEQMGGLDSYVAFLSVRDSDVARVVEPHLYIDAPYGGGGLQGDPRFGTLA